MKYLVFGGNSPIATAISKSLSVVDQVWHVTRNITESIQNQFIGMNVKLLELDLNSPENFTDNFSLMLEKENFDGIIFAHRYRGDLDNHIERHQVEVLSPYVIADLFCKIKSKKDRKLLFFTSPAADLVVDDQPFGYHASKAAINQLIRYLSIKFGQLGVATNGIAPGSYIYKERAKKFWKENSNYLDEVENLIPVKRIGTIEDIVIVARFLLKDSTNFINGIIIDSDGGLKNLESSSVIRSQNHKDKRTH
jgi:NAD(P)-dependent dehydrogenase (short-subunit alcohol dehydrogenase family)